MGENQIERDEIENANSKTDLETALYLDAISTIVSLRNRIDFRPERIKDGVASDVACIVCMEPIGELSGGLYIGEGEFTPSVNYDHLLFPGATFGSIVRMMSDMVAHIVEAHTSGFDTHAKLMILMNNAMRNLGN